MGLLQFSMESSESVCDEGFGAWEDVKQRCT